MITETAQRVLEERYFLEGESTWEDLTERVGGYFGKAHEEECLFINTMRDMDFLPNSPALMNGGTAIEAYSACYVLPVEDSIESIYKFYSDAAIISKSGGGVGCNYSPIRASNSIVASTNGVASGPLSFMKVQDVSTDIIKQGGRRRGANMGILDCDHPDIWDFISVKDTEGVLSNFNLSVGITDSFMDEVLNPHVTYGKNTELWDELIQRAWSSAEPGVIFMDTIEKGNTVPHLGKLDCTNPCGEQPLRPYESCLAKGTLVTTPQGVRKIEDMAGTSHVIGTDYKAHTYLKVVNKGTQPVIKMNLSNRSTLVCTPDHQIELVSGSFVDAKDTVGKSVKVLSGVTPYTLYDAPSEVHEMIGWLHGDGWYSTTVGISFNAKDGDFEIKDRISQCFINTFDVTTKPNINTEERYQHQSDKKSSLEIAESFGMVKSRCTEVEFPSKFYSWTDPQQRSFIRGLFSADAGISGKANTQVAFATSSDKLGNQVVAYLNSIGIHTSKFTTVFKSNRNNQYRIQVTKQSANIFMDTVGLLTSVKKDKFVRSRYADETSYKVASVEDFGSEEVFDIVEVSNINTFWANGIGVHNCTLGSINLSNHVMSLGPFTGEDFVTRDVLQVDYVKLRDTTRTGVLFLNRILDASVMPIPECQEAMERTRKIGLGIMGLHDMLIQLGLPYDSEEGRTLAGEVMEFISREADKKSYELAMKEGHYDGYDTIPDGIPYRRNANLTTIAPTGTLSMISNCSSGCEPYYAPVTVKEVLDGTKFIMPNKWLPQEAKEAIEQGYEWDLMVSNPDLFKSAGDIHWSDHIKMQAVLQKHIDSSISKTINMPNDTTVKEVKEAYELAYKLGCKGVTIYRDGSRETQVLSASTEGDTREQGPVDNPRSKESFSKAVLPDELKATRYRVTVDGQKVYIIVAEDASGAPVEVFVKFPYASIDSCWNTVCRQLSLSMRYGVPLTDIIKQLDKSVVVINDVASHLSRILKMYQQARGTEVEMKGCPECGSPLQFTEGCEKCSGGCGWSKCG